MPGHWQSMTSFTQGKTTVYAAISYLTEPNGKSAIYISKDDGKTWNKSMSAGIRSWQNNISSASDGVNSIIIAPVSAGYIYTSTDLGDTWQSNEPVNSSTMQVWNSLVSFPDGNNITEIAVPKETAESDRYLKISRDAGMTWSPLSSAGQDSWSSIASSTSSNHTVLAAASLTGSGGTIYISTDLGQTWSHYTPASVPYGWESISVATDNTRTVIAAIAKNRDGTASVFTSSDLGTTWVEKPLPNS